MFINEKLQEFEKYIYNKKIALVELEVHNSSLIDYLLEKGANITVFDKRNIDEIEPEIVDKITSRCIKFSFGEHCLVNLIGFDLIFKSPSCRPDCPEIKAESIRGAIITSEIEMLLNLCPGKVIGVTGSKGKTTTACLIYSILKENSATCFLGGTLGMPLFPKIREMKPDCFVVLELNNDQLMGMQISPEIAVITNTYSDDNDNNYEKNIFKFQDNNGKVIVNYEDEATKYLLPDVKGRIKYFSSKTKLENGIIYDKGVIKSCTDGVRMHILTIDDAISMHQIFSYDNICAAVAATQDIVDPKIQARGIIKFRGIEYFGI